MKILFITRKYPPIVGGMENYSFNLFKNLKKINPETYLIANTKGNKNLLNFYFYAYKKAINLIKEKKITHLHAGDALLAPLGNKIKKKTNVKTSITIHGLDITYNFPFYRKTISKSLKSYDKIISVSNATKDFAVKNLKLNSNKIEFIPNGINPDEFFIKLAKKSNKKEITLFTAGRLIKRKGVEWLVRNVIPKLGEEYVYLVSGDGPERKNIERAISEKKLERRVKLLGKTNLDKLKELYNSSDLFIMPNIKIDGDMEGFGIVAIEASSCGLPVIASNIEGIKDAVINGKTGWLVESENIGEFIKKINSKKLNPIKVRNETSKKFDWDLITSKYLETII